MIRRAAVVLTEPARDLAARYRPGLAAGRPPAAS